MVHISSYMAAHATLHHIFRGPVQNLKSELQYTLANNNTPHSEQKLNYLVGTHRAKSCKEYIVQSI